MGIRGLFLAFAGFAVLPAGVTSLVASWASSAGSVRAPGLTAQHEPAALGVLDRNDDGRISRSEHADAAEKIFRFLDADADGVIDPHEIESARRRSTEPASGDALDAERIAAIDRNGDDLLSADEHAAAATAIFDRFDADDDGFLTLAEIQMDRPERPEAPERADPAAIL